MMELDGRQPLFQQPLFGQSVERGSGWVGSWFFGR